MSAAPQTQASWPSRQIDVELCPMPDGRRAFLVVATTTAAPHECPIGLATCGIKSRALASRFGSFVCERIEAALAERRPVRPAIRDAARHLPKISHDFAATPETQL